MGKIVAIGGGELSKGETYKIDQFIIEFANQDKPKTLFVPTASYEPEGYCERFKELYQNQLGAVVEVLYLLDNQLSIYEIEEKIKWADIIYVGGGDTNHMLKVWKEKHVDYFLKEAYKRGVLLCGLSAGSICWFSYGQSEVEYEDSEDGYKYIELEGLGILNAFHCPHFEEGRRSVEFSKMIKVSNRVGITLENNCAIVIGDGKYRIITSQENKKAYKIYLQDGECIQEEIQQVDQFKSIEELGITEGEL
ncbi:Type 1 glutamine amidotransferase-like domain-containing protein [Niameybacter massiliensis]|uniref:Type 1 glutamine amidotransferase-like domain-containing protein n=1 Tax=Holtiella tumoricola TaxID=3018743 RepID=A0AA42DR39_9FIRM|nr:MULTISPECIES: Type 1 glutamine amidotransferase-like domain-containing protein [Lachnospirales]MDA3733718.1 Type 1 glutamine amidotransferase-like domain-containing protein [Holtiella tumoricola]